MSAIYRLLFIFDQNCPTQQSHGLFAIAKLLVSFDTHTVSPRRPRNVPSKVYPRPNS